MPALNEALTLESGITLPNRLFKSAMSETLADGEGAPTERHIRLYRRWARGGMGTLITGNVMIDARALGEPGNVILEDDRHLEQFRHWAAAAKTDNTVVYMQLNHPGRQAPRFLNSEAVAPSAVPLNAKMRRYFPPPRALTGDEVEELVERFGRAAELADRAGFDGVQIHGAHGYLVSQFLSPHTNQRDDAWGGSAAARRRFPLAIAQRIHDMTRPGFGVSIKMNSADFQRGGFTEDESTETAIALAEAGMDFIEISGGTYESPAMMGPQKASTAAREAYFLEFAETLRGQTNVHLGLTGGFRSAAGMSHALESGAVDLVGLARPVALYPEFPGNVLTDESARIEVPRPTTGIKFIDRLGMLDVVYYEYQLHLMGDGRDPRPTTHPLRAMLRHGLGSGLSAFKARRG